MSKKERETCELEMDFKKSLLLPSSLSNDDIISSRSGLKTRFKNDVFWSEIGRHTSTKNSLKHPPPPPSHPRSLLCARETNEKLITHNQLSRKQRHAQKYPSPRHQSTSAKNKCLEAIFIAVLWVCMKIIAAKGAFLVGCFKTRVARQDKIREGTGGRPGHLIKLYFSHANKAYVIVVVVVNIYEGSIPRPNLLSFYKSSFKEKMPL